VKPLPRRAHRRGGARGDPVPAAEGEHPAKALIPLFEISNCSSRDGPGALFRIVTDVLVKEFSVERVSLMLVRRSDRKSVIRASHGSDGPRGEGPSHGGRRRVRHRAEAAAAR